MKTVWTESGRALWVRLVCIQLVAVVLSNSPAAADDQSAVAGTDIEVGQPARIEIEPQQVRLSGPRSARQLLVTGYYQDGAVRDLTRGVRWQIVDPAVIEIGSTGQIVARQDGSTRVRVSVGDLYADAEVAVEQTARTRNVSFRREVVPVLSRAGCSDIRCHGAPSGKSGFRLSLWGHDPDFDLQQLTRDASGRRTNPLNPAESLILRKAFMRIPHVGGRRFSETSRMARLLDEWQSQGQQDDVETVRVSSLKVTPSGRVLRAPAVRQQLVVQVAFGDGQVQDVTHLTTFSSTDLSVADVNQDGLVEFHRQGEVAILCRYCGAMESVRLMHIASPPADFVWSDPPENNWVDQHVFTKLRMLHLPPSELSSDEVFVRRVYLDLCGVLPTVAESRAFLSETAPDKRARLIDTLLDRPEFADYWTKKWLDVLRVSRDSIQLAGAQAFQEWLRERIRADAPLDGVVRELLTATGESYRDPAVNFYCVPRTPETITDPLYLQKDLAEATAQLFLGIRLQCAQCHNHPYERWTQNDYQSLAAFFTQVKRTRLGKPGRKGRPERRQIAVSVDFEAAELVSESTGATMTPGFPGEPPVDFDPRQDRRPLLARWLTDEQNPFFAKAFVNRVWYHLHGRGIVEPVDDFRDSNPSANDPLLDALATDFIRNGYRLKPLIRTIANSRTYQLSSQPNEWNASDTRYFSHMLARPLPAEVLLDAVSQVTAVPEVFEISKDYIEGLPDGTVQFPEGTRAVQLPVNDVATLINTEGKYVRYELHPFLRVFGQPNGTETCECARETAFGRKQALELFVGELLNQRLTHAENRLSKLLQKDLSDAARLNELYQLALSRDPSEATAARYLRHVTSSSNRRQAWEDVLWTVLNSQEFIYQH